MTPWLRITALGLAALSLAACSSGSVSDMLGLGKRSPDEFAVVRRQPLVIPPDFQLRPPGAGETRPAAGTTADRARESLIGEATESPGAAPSLAEPADTPGTASEGTSALLARTNRAAADPVDPRSAPQDGAADAGQEQSLFSRLLDAQPADEGSATTTSDDVSPGDPPTVLRRSQTPLGELVERDS